jgi:hypothetical protein
LQVAYLIVESDQQPELLKDQYWDSKYPRQVESTEFEGSAETCLQVTEAEKVSGWWIQP